jgi:hypothetical protein
MNQTLGAGSPLRPLITAGLAAIFLLAGACASTPPAPESALDAARVAILNAEKREKLALADTAVKDEDMVAADRLAQESRVQAELASARTAAAKAASVNDEMRRGDDALAEEMQRSGEPR